MQSLPTITPTPEPSTAPAPAPSDEPPHAQRERTITFTIDSIDGWAVDISWAVYTGGWNGAYASEDLKGIIETPWTHTVVVPAADDPGADLSYALYSSPSGEPTNAIICTVEVDGEVVSHFDPTVYSHISDQYQAVFTSCR